MESSKLCYENGDVMLILNQTEVIPRFRRSPLDQWNIDKRKFRGKNYRLDRKSSRGMIYENEELRLRTININAEVERGQSDIRKLRRENEQLRREIWSLRDEYDRLNRLLRTNRSTESCGENNGNNSGTQDEESDSCDTCKEDDGEDDIICDGIQCNLQCNKNKCDEDHCDHDHHNDCHDHHCQQQQSSSSCSSESKKKILSSSLSSPSSLLSNNGSKEITENYENLQKSILDNNSASGNNYNKNNCNTSSCNSPSIGNNNKTFNANKMTASSRNTTNANNQDESSSSLILLDLNLSSGIGNGNDDGTDNTDKLRDNLHVNFDHLSVVSEENLTNSDGNSVQQSDIDPLSSSSAATTVINLQDSLKSTLVPTTKDANNKNLNRISDIELLVPPLSHFENISYEKIGPSLADLEDVNYSSSASKTKDALSAANGWDFSITTTSKPLASSTATQTQNDDMTSSTDHQNLVATEMDISSSFKIAQHLLDAKSSSLSTIDRSRSPKHFFSPIKPRPNFESGHSLSSSPLPLSLSTFQPQKQKQDNQSYENYNGPDVFVANALASSPYHTTKPQKSNNQTNIEPIYASVQKPLSSGPSRKCSESSFQTGGNLEDLLMDIEALSQDILQMQLKKQKSLSEDQLDNGGATSEEGNLSNRKPFRSEMNLVLTYNGTNPVITPIMKSTTSTSLNCGFTVGNNITNNGGDKDFSAATTMERESVRGTPPLPNVPEPMSLFPENRSYLGFENFGQPPITSLAGGKPILSIFNKAHKKKPLLSETLETSVIHPSSNTDTNEITTVIDKTNPNIPNCNEDKLITIGTVKGSKQHLMDKKRNNKTGNSASETANCDSSSGSESTVKRKSRRVSVLFRKSEDNSKETKKGNEKDQKGNKSEVTADITSDQITSTVATITATTITVNNENQQSQNSTGNDEKTIQGSPHSDRHRSNCSLTSGRHHHHHHHGHHYHHHQGRKMSQDSGSGKHSAKLQLSPGDNNEHTTAINNFAQDDQKQQQAKVGRRYSEGTVLATITGANLDSNEGNGCGSDTSGGGGGTRHHHPHHHHIGGGVSGHHHHHHHHHTRHDSYNDGGGGTSISERNSNSLASSRESSTSLSTRSQRRKISISSHSGGKIPWCGCWGNGCL